MSLAAVANALLGGGVPPRQDFVVLGGKKTPGRATIVGAGSPRTWQKNKAWGFSGATLTFTGDDLPDFDIVVDLWEKKHWAEWDDFATVLGKRPKAPSTSNKPPTLTIKHPLVNRPPWDIAEVVVRDVTSFEQSESGLWTTKIQVTAWRAPKFVLAKAGDIPSAAPGKIEDDPDISKLLGEVKALGG